MTKVHLHYPIFWTACNMASRRLPLGHQLQITKNKEKVTCGSCRSTQAFFSRDDDPTAEVETKTIGKQLGHSQ